MYSWAHILEQQPGDGALVTRRHPQQPEHVPPAPCVLQVKMAHAKVSRIRLEAMDRWLQQIRWQQRPGGRADQISTRN